MGESKKKEKCLKKSNILVYQQPTGERVARKEDPCKHRKIPICKPQPKHIKICTGAELRKMCPPNVCPCEPPKAKSRFGLVRLLGFGLKSVVAAAVVYITYDMGIWGTTDETQELYGTACHLFGAPKPKKNDKWDPPSCEAESELFTKREFKPYGHCDDPPLRTEDTYLKFKKLWNGAITAVFHGIANFPSNVMNRDSTKSENLKPEPVCMPYAKLDASEKEKISNQYK